MIRTTGLSFNPRTQCFEHGDQKIPFESPLLEAHFRIDELIYQLGTDKSITLEDLVTLRANVEEAIAERIQDFLNE
jgi:hypothetical protein